MQVLDMDVVWTLSIFGQHPELYIFVQRPELYIFVQHPDVVRLHKGIRRFSTGQVRVAQKCTTSQCCTKMCNVGTLYKNVQHELVHLCKFHLVKLAYF